MTKKQPVIRSRVRAERNYAVVSARARSVFARGSRAISRIDCAAQSALYVTLRYGRLEFQAGVASKVTRV